jgi:hypothetical protein
MTFRGLSPGALKLDDGRPGDARGRSVSFEAAAARLASERRADSMHDAVGVGVDELPKTVRRVVRPHEPAFDTAPGVDVQGEDRAAAARVLGEFLDGHPCGGHDAGVVAESGMMRFRPFCPR